MSTSNTDQQLEERVSVEGFVKILHREPNQAELQPTPDGKAFHFPISYVEMTLDELFFGLWSTENFRWSAIQNEVQGAIDLVVVHPINGMQIRRTGTASIQIMVDAVPDAIKNDRQQRNTWATSVENKKPNALDMGFPKLKAECIKNAAQSLGKAFGRDVNRKQADQYKPLISGSTAGIRKIVENAISSGKYEQARKLLAETNLPLEIKVELTSKIPA